MTKLPSLIALLVLAACGDNHRQAPPDALTSDAPPADAPAAPPVRAVIAAGDFNPGDPGVLSTLDPATRKVVQDVGPAGAVGSDPVLRHIGRELFVVNRGENNVTILDDQTLAFKEQIGTGPGSNPQDVAIVGNKLYVPSLGSKGVVVLTRGSTATTEIDLSADDRDGKPDCMSAYLVGTQLYVACGLLHGFVASAPGKVYVVDTTTDTVQPALTVTLGHKNPFGWFEQFPAGGSHAGALALPTVEDFSGPGCVELVSTGATPASGGCLVDNAALGGLAGRLDIEVDSDARIVWTIVSTTDFLHEDLRAFDMSLDALWSGPLNPGSELVTDVAHCPSGEVVVFDSTRTAPGLRIYRGASEATTAALPIGKIQAPSPQHGLVCY